MHTSHPTTRSARELPTLLVVSQDRSPKPAWISALRSGNFHAVQHSSFAAALDLFEQTTPDVILIDATGSMPNVLRMIHELRQAAANPVLLLCEACRDDDLLSAYEAGVDECIPKTISSAVLLAKVRSWLRRSWTVPVGFLGDVSAGGLALLPSQRHLVMGDGSIASLTNLELRLLHVLMARPDQPISADELIRRTWRDPSRGDPAALKNVVYRIRHKIEPQPASPRRLLSVPGAGYMFSTR